MSASKLGLAALMIVAGMASSAPAQTPTSAAWTASGVYPAAQTGRDLGDYYGMTPIFSSYGLSGTLPGYGGYGYPGYGPGPQFGAHSGEARDSKPTAPSKPPARSGPVVPKPSPKPDRPGVKSTWTNPTARKLP